MKVLYRNFLRSITAQPSAKELKRISTFVGKTAPSKHQSEDSNTSDKSGV